MLPNFSAGGAERALITLMNNLDRTRFEPLFLALNETGPAREWLAPDILVFTFTNRTIKGSVLKLISFIKEHRPDILFTTMVHINGLALLMKLFFPRLRVIVREAALPYVLITQYGPKGRLCWFIYKLLYQRADLVISNCSQMIDQFRNDIKISTHNHAVLFNPVDTQRVLKNMPEVFENIPGRDKTLSFVCVGRLSYEKGYDRLIESLAKTDLPVQNWRLDLIGEGDHRKDLERLIAEHHLGDHVFLRGYHDQPWSVASQADALLLPSRWEGMPNVVLEGFACGLPAIAMREAGGISDIAKYARPQDLKIVDTMDEFVSAMQHVQITPKQTPALSILPEVFALPSVMRQFEDYLIPAKTS